MWRLSGLIGLCGLVVGCFGDDIGDDTDDTATATASASATATASTSEGTGETSVGTSDGTTTNTSVSTSVGTTETSSTSAPACVSDDECPPSAEPCRIPRCTAGVCGQEPAPKGTMVDDVAGDCRQTVCDGVGGGESVPFDDPPEDEVGDCKSVICEAGEVTYVANDDDLPNDDVECTVDTCESGVITFTPKPVNSFCGEMGAAFCHDDTVCRRCQQIVACEDPGPEPNETQETAHYLGKISDADSAGGFVCGALNGPGDVDWYRFVGDDAFLNVVDPKREIDAKGVGRICAYAQCLNGNTSVTCFTETPDTAPGGQKGCCDPVQVKPYVECAGLDDSAEMWIRIDNPGAEMCLEYDFDYHF